MCQREGEERALLRADEHRAVAVFVAAGIERHQNELLRLEPFHGLLTQLVELVAVNVSKALFVGRLVVRDAHAVRLAAAHIVLGEVNGCTVLAADNVRFLEQTLAGYVKYNVVHISMLGTEYHVVQLCLAGRHGNALAIFDHVGQFLCEREFLEQRVHQYIPPYTPEALFPKQLPMLSIALAIST